MAQDKFQKFGDMPWGTHFSDGRRKFIKLQLVTASGIKQTVHRDVEGQRVLREEFNAIDYNGILACCPDWLDFQIIKQPAKPLDGGPTRVRGRWLNKIKLNNQFVSGSCCYPRLQVNKNGNIILATSKHRGLTTGILVGRCFKTQRKTTLAIPIGAKHVDWEVDGELVDYDGEVSITVSNRTKKRNVLCP